MKYIKNPFGKYLNKCTRRPLKKILFVAMPLFFGLAFVEAQKIDSLKSLLNEDRRVGEYELLYQIAYEYVDLDNEQGLYYSNQSLEAARRIGDSLGIVKAGRLKCLTLRRLNNIDSAINLASKILPIAVRNGYSDEVRQILNGMANAYSINGLYDKALENYLTSLDIMKSPKDDPQNSITLNNVGIIYYNLNDYDKALEYFIKSLALKRKTGFKTDLDILMINISLCYACKNDFYMARNFIDQADLYCGKHCPDNVLMQKYFCSGVISIGMKKYLEAKIHLTKSYVLAKKLRNQQFLLDNINCFFQIASLTNRDNSEQLLVQEAENVVKSKISYSKGLIELYFNLFTFYARMASFKKVAYYQQKYITLKNSIYNEDLTTNLMKIEADYLERENRAKIENQNRILALNEKVIYRQRFMNVFIGVIAVLLIILAIVLVRWNRAKKIANRFLESKVNERTKELETNRSELQWSLKEQDVVIKKIAFEVNNSVATIKGLCALGLKDNNPGSSVQYIEKIDTTTDQLLRLMLSVGGDKIFSRKD